MRGWSSPRSFIRRSITRRTRSADLTEPADRLRPMCRLDRVQACEFELAVLRDRLGDPGVEGVLHRSPRRSPVLVANLQGDLVKRVTSQGEFHASGPPPLGQGLARRIGDPLARRRYLHAHGSSITAPSSRGSAQSWAARGASPDGRIRASTTVADTGDRQHHLALRAQSVDRRRAARHVRAAPAVRRQRHPASGLTFPNESVSSSMIRPRNKSVLGRLSRARYLICQPSVLAPRWRRLERKREKARRLTSIPLPSGRPQGPVVGP